MIKEMLAVWRDRRSRAMLIAPPLLQLLVFSFSATQEVKNVSIAVVNEDWGQAGRTLMARFQGSPTFTEVIVLPSRHEAARVLDTQQALIVLGIGPTFSRDIAAGQPARVQILLDGRRSNAAQMVSAYAGTIIAGAGAELRAPPEDPAAKPGAGPGVLVSRAWFNPNLLALWSTVPALVGILSTTIALMVTALSVARERELGTFEQLLVSPLQPVEILIGKALPGVIIGIGEASIMVFFGIVVLGVPFTGSIALLYASLAVFLMAIVGVGLFISSLATTQQQAVLGAFTFMVPAILLSGYASPVENMPDWLQMATLANPVRHFMTIARGLFLRDMSAAAVLDSLWPMAVIAVATLSLATWLFRRRVG